MKRRFFAGAPLLAVLCGAAGAQGPAAIDTSGWATYRNEKFGFEVRHPAFLYERAASGTRDGVPTESVAFTATAVAGKPQEGLQFFVQRGVNVRRLSVEQWVAEQMKRINHPPALATIPVGGRTAVWYRRQRAFGNAYTFHVPLASADVLSISIIRPASEAELSAVYAAIIGTLRVIE